MRRFDDQMKVVFHQTIGVDDKTGFGASLRDSFEKIVTVPVVQEDGPALISAAHHMLSRAWIFDAHQSWHKGMVI